jgi:hypothetical protein
MSATIPDVPSYAPPPMRPRVRTASLISVDPILVQKGTAEVVARRKRLMTLVAAVLGLASAVCHLAGTRAFVGSILAAEDDAPAAAHVASVARK